MCDSLVWVWGVFLYSLWETLGWVLERNFVVCVQQFREGFGERVCCVLESFVWVWRSEIFLFLVQFGLKLGK